VKRHPGLAPLSREHQHTLSIAQRLRRATPSTAPQASAAFLAVWELEEKQHFRVEEEILLPAYAAFGNPTSPLVITVLLDHLCIRRDAQALLNGAPLEVLQALGERLAAHVRLEERELFPLIEATIPEPDMRILQGRLEGVGR
jgi:hemerythrin-like domain-containing protein